LRWEDFSPKPKPHIKCFNFVSLMEVKSCPSFHKSWKMTVTEAVTSWKPRTKNESSQMCPGKVMLYFISWDPPNHPRLMSTVHILSILVKSHQFFFTFYSPSLYLALTFISFHWDSFISLSYLPPILPLFFQSIYNHCQNDISKTDTANHSLQTKSSLLPILLLFF
jgi:hypothetical protein